MKHYGPPEENPLGRLADRRAAEYFERLLAESQAKHDAAMVSLRNRLGLKAGETLEEFVGLKAPGGSGPNIKSPELAPEVAELIDDFLDKIGRVLNGEAEFDSEFPPPQDPK